MNEHLQGQEIPVMSPAFRLQWEPAQGCHVILYPEGMVKLNEAAGEILKRCDGERTVAQIIADLSGEFPDADNLQVDVYHFLSTAHEHKWIQWRPA
jgi:pyrroloquinoline quinone biosynthesis protein D